MTIEQFPPHELADEHGLLAVGGDVEVDSLLLAYRTGIFPWPIQSDLLTWFSPPERALVMLDTFTYSRTFKKFLKKHPFSVYVNRDFPSVILNCQHSPHRVGQEGTWITDSLVDAYIELHKAGYAHSIEAYEGERLVGGLYGVSVGGMFAGESMFYIKDNASKLCFAFLVEWLRRGGASWIDCQVMTPLTESLGAIDMSRDNFLKLLEVSIRTQVQLFPADVIRVGVWRGESL